MSSKRLGHVARSTNTSRRPAPTRTRSLPAWGASLAVALVALAACVAGIANDFTNDDVHLIAENVRVQGLAHWQEWFTRPFWPPPFSPDLYRPLTQAMLTLEHMLGSGSPMIFRVVSYLLYALASVAVLKLARRLMPEPYALGAAFLFAAHPVHVEAIALGVGQGELIVAAIALFSCRLYIDKRRAGTLEARHWAVLAALYLAASLTKENGLMIPAFLVAAESIVLPNAPQKWSRSMLGGFALLVAGAWGVVVAREHVLGEFSGTFVAEALERLGVRGRALTMLAVVPQWARLMVWPAHLSADYSPQQIIASTHFGATEMCGVTIVVVALATAWVARRSAPQVTFGLAWFAIGIAPVSNVLIPTGIVIAERTLLLPSIGAAIAVAGLAEWAARSPFGARVPARDLAYVCGALVLLGVVRSGARQRIWLNEGTYVTQGVKDAPRSFRMQQAYGNVLFEIHQDKLAFDAYDRALQYAPTADVWRVRNDLARTLADQGDVAGAADQLTASLAQRPDQEFERGQLLVDDLYLGRYADARAEADSALARGDSHKVFADLRAVADSAQRVGARPGSVELTLQAGAVTAPR